MFRKIGIAAAFVVLAAGGAFAQSAERQIRDQLRSQGFTQIEIERDDGRIEVEARRGGQKVELKYDARTGRLISQRVTRSEAGGTRSGSRPTTGGGRTVRSDDDDDRGRGGSRAGRDDDDDDRGRGGRGGRNDDDDDRGGRGGNGGGGGGRDDDDDDRGGNDNDDDD